MNLKEPVFHQVNLALLEKLSFFLIYAALVECFTGFYSWKEGGRQAQFAFCFFLKRYCCPSCYRPLTWWPGKLEWFNVSCVLAFDLRFHEVLSVAGVTRWPSCGRESSMSPRSLLSISSCRETMTWHRNVAWVPEHQVLLSALTYSFVVFFFNNSVLLCVNSSWISAQNIF